MNTQRRFTGWHMIAVMVGFFGTIIAVNLTMASFARSSWTGLVVANSYVASQQFNERMAESRAQAALGWNGTLETDAGHIRYRLADRNGLPVEAAGGKVVFRHPAYEGADWSAELKAGEKGLLVAEAKVVDGVWLVEMDIDAGLVRPYRRMIRVTIDKGIIQ
ncbi:cytochrome oxidase [Phyllobacterium phragmitis]|uniref:Cytochrome oxidase n=1 Tax=Phyllobacterium phragmitis TaxID=2670329 RepID=A0A2S9IMX3_9HYPH|nr:FixH family protein [Phyllobacterium phragmitis]PRD41857.1 cytochrome oxidase [Phyllobacterium phragmitis]